MQLYEMMIYYIIESLDTLTYSETMACYFKSYFCN